MLQLDAEALYAELREGVRGLVAGDAALVGIWSGGAWLAERLQRDLALPGRHRAGGASGRRRSSQAGRPALSASIPEKKSQRNRVYRVIAGAES